MDLSKIKTAIEQFQTKKVLVLGDIMLDHYTFGDVTRISPEAPVPVFSKKRETFVLGGAANTAHNLAALGAQVILGGVVGNDPEQHILLKLLAQKNIAADAVLVDSDRSTTTKNRLVSGITQLMRIDREHTHPLSHSMATELHQRVRTCVAQCDAVLISDYAKGFFAHSYLSELLDMIRKEKKPILAAFKPVNKDLFIGVDYAICNLKEGRDASGKTELEHVGRHLADTLQTIFFLTRGGDGMSVFSRDGHESIATKKVDVFDVSGAGDTVAATVLLSVITGLSSREAAHLGNYAGSIVVQKTGTAVVTSEELLSFVHGDCHLEDALYVSKVWGYERWLENNDRYCCKLLSLNKGYQCSLHFHKAKDETFLVIKGHIRLEVGDKVLHLHSGNFMRIPPGTIHRFRGIEDSLIIETSTHHEESDSHRLEESCMFVSPEYVA